MYEQLNDLDEAADCFGRALRQHQWSIPALSGLAGVLKNKEEFLAATEHYTTILKIDSANGDAWGCLGKLRGSRRRKSLILSQVIVT